MRNPAALALLLAVLLSASAAHPANGQAAPPDSAAMEADTVPLATRERIVASLDSLVREKFAHWEGAPGLDYQRAVAEYRDAARASGERLAFDLATMAFVARLRNGHTSFSDPWLWEHHGAPLGFTLRPLEGKWVVGSSSLPGLRAGSVVTAIDGEPFEAFFQRQQRYIAASGERMARHVLGYRSFLFPERFTLTLADGARVPVERRAPPAPPASPGPDTAEIVPHRWLVPDRVAYLRVPAFEPGRYEARALEVVGGFRDAPVLVVDVRGNGGGNTPWQLEKALSGQVRAWKRVHDHVRPTPSDSADWEAAKEAAEVPAFRGRVLVLANGLCFSACEDFVGSLRGLPRVTVVGDTTGGSTGQPVFVRWPNGMSARVSARRLDLPDGTPFEGAGVAPDVLALPTPEDLVAGTDLVLARALELVRGAGTSSAPTPPARH